MCLLSFLDTPSKGADTAQINAYKNQSGNWHWPGFSQTAAHLTAVSVIKHAAAWLRASAPL